MILKCAIIDDEPLAISLLESYVNKTPFLELAGKYNSAVNALPALSKEPVDLLSSISRCRSSTEWSFPHPEDRHAHHLYDCFQPVCARQL